MISWTHVRDGQSRASRNATSHDFFFLFCLGKQRKKKKVASFFSSFKITQQDMMESQVTADTMEPLPTEPPEAEQVLSFLDEVETGMQDIEDVEFVQAVEQLEAEAQAKIQKEPVLTEKKSKKTRGGKKNTNKKQETEPVETEEPEEEYEIETIVSHRMYRVSYFIMIMIVKSKF